MPLQSEKLRLLRRIPDIRFEEEARGYSKDQVDRVLANLAPLADEIERLQARLSEAETRAASAEARLVEARSPSAMGAPDMPPAPQPDFDETLRNTLVSAQRQADTTVRESREEAERLRTEAEFQSNALLADARDQSAEMTTEAVAYRERLMAEAAAERARLLEEASGEARSRVEAVESELAEAHEKERGDLISQIADLTDKHRLLQGDVDRFEQHLANRSAEVRSALAEITSVLDDPNRLRPEGGIEPAELDEFEPEDYPPIAVEVVSLVELENESEAAKVTAAPLNEPIDAADLDLTESAATAQVADAELDLTDNGLAAVSDDYVTDDPQLGVQTQIVPPPPIAVEEEDATGVLEGDVQTATDVNGTGDPYAEELLRATTDDVMPEDEAISDFFDDNEGPERGGGGWFGRRR